MGVSARSHILPSLLNYKNVSCNCYNVIIVVYSKRKYNHALVRMNNKCITGHLTAHFRHCFLGGSQSPDVRPWQAVLTAPGWLSSSVHLDWRTLPGAAQWNLHNTGTGGIKNMYMIVLYIIMCNKSYATKFAHLLYCHQIKRENRQCEALLHDVEIASCLAMCRDPVFVYPVDKLQELWRWEEWVDVVDELWKLLSLFSFTGCFF